MNESELMIYPKQQKDTTVLFLAWKFLLSRMNPLREMVYFVDAQGGGIIDSMNNLKEGDVLRGQVTGSFKPDSGPRTSKCGTLSANKSPT